MSITNGNGHYPKARNVLGGELKSCCTDPMTGFYRDGYCRTGAEDAGRHTVCIFATDEFLAYSKSVGNDLSTPMPQYDFPGLKGGDKWCLVAMRWKQALDDGMAPVVDLEATHESTLQIVDLEDLKRYAAESE
jgi:uncharacterized protein (DUF2237 family)